MTRAGRSCIVFASDTLKTTTLSGCEPSSAAGEVVPQGAVRSYRGISESSEDAARSFQRAVKVTVPQGFLIRDFVHDCCSQRRRSRQSRLRKRIPTPEYV